MKGFRRQLCICVLGGVLLSSYLPYKCKKYAEYFFQKYSAELFREQRFNLQTLRISYDNQSISHVVLRFTCFRAMDIYEARKLLVDTVRDIVEKAGQDKMLNRYQLVKNGHLCIPNLEIEITSDCYLSETIDATFIKNIILKDGWITYKTNKISPTTSTGREYIKETFRDAELLAEEKKRPDIALEISEFKQQIAREKAKKRKTGSFKVTWEEGTNIPASEEVFKAVVTPVEENVPLVNMPPQQQKEEAVQNKEEQKPESKETTPAPEKLESQPQEMQPEKQIHAIPMTPIEEFSEEHKESELQETQKKSQEELNSPTNTPAQPEETSIPTVPAQACERLQQMELTPVEAYSCESSVEKQQEKDASIAVADASQNKVAQSEETRAPEKKGFIELIKSFFSKKSVEEKKEEPKKEEVKVEEVEPVAPTLQEEPKVAPVVVVPQEAAKVEENKLPEAAVEQQIKPVEDVPVTLESQPKEEPKVAPIVVVPQEAAKVEENKLPEAAVEQQIKPVEEVPVAPGSQEGSKVEEVVPVIPIPREEAKIEEQPAPQIIQEEQKKPAEEPVSELPLSEEEVKKILDSIPDVEGIPTVEEVSGSESRTQEEHASKPESTVQGQSPVVEEPKSEEFSTPAEVQQPEVVPETHPAEEMNKPVHEDSSAVTPAEAKEEAQNATQDFIKRMWSSVWKTTPEKKQEEVAVEENQAPSQQEQQESPSQALPAEEAPSEEANVNGGGISQNFDEPAAFLQYPYPPAIVSDVEIDNDDSSSLQ